MHTKILFLSVLFFSASSCAMDPQLQVLVEGTAEGGAQQETQVTVLQAAGDSTELYRLIGEHNRHYVEGYESEVLLKAFDRMKLENPGAYTELVNPVPSPHTRKHKKHHAKHHKPAPHQGNDKSGHAKHEQDGGPEVDSEEEKEGVSPKKLQAEMDADSLATAQKNQELAQAHFIAALLSVLSQQEKERANKAESEKKEAEAGLQETKIEAEKQSNCAKLIGLLLVLATAAGTAWGSACQAVISK